MMLRTKKLRVYGDILYHLIASTVRLWSFENELLAQHLLRSPILGKGVQPGESAYNRGRVMEGKKNNTKKINDI